MHNPVLVARSVVLGVVAERMRAGHVAQDVAWGTGFGQGDDVVDGRRPWVWPVRVPVDRFAADVTGPVVAIEDLNSRERLDPGAPAACPPILRVGYVLTTLGAEPSLALLLDRHPCVAPLATTIAEVRPATRKSVLPLPAAGRAELLAPLGLLELRSTVSTEVMLGEFAPA